LTWYSYRELQVEPLGLKEWDLVQKWEIATIECLIFLALKKFKITSFWRIDNNNSKVNRRNPCE
jgi:hypothetical protein